MQRRRVLLPGRRRPAAVAAPSWISAHREDIKGDACVASTSKPPAVLPCITSTTWYRGTLNQGGVGGRVWDQRCYIHQVINGVVHGEFEGVGLGRARFVGIINEGARTFRFITYQKPATSDLAVPGRYYGHITAHRKLVGSWRGLGAMARAAPAIIQLPLKTAATPAIPAIAGVPPPNLPTTIDQVLPFLSQHLPGIAITLDVNTLHLDAA